MTSRRTASMSHPDLKSNLDHDNGHLNYEPTQAPEVPAASVARSENAATAAVPSEVFLPADISRLPACRVRACIRHSRSSRGFVCRTVLSRAVPRRQRGWSSRVCVLGDVGGLALGELDRGLNLVLRYVRVPGRLHQLLGTRIPGRDPTTTAQLMHVHGQRQRLRER
jgi:hypothetical protein